MSRIFQTLGASPEELPGLWIAAPLTGLLVQPIIGYWSDRTWSPKWGRRRPYFMIGAILSSAALFIMPHSSALWMAAGLLWVLDASINISMEPFRALVADKLPEDQRNFGFVLQTLIIGIGTWVASNLPWIVTQLGAKNEAPAGEIPDSVFYSFAVGAAVFLITIIVTVWTTDEDPPEDLAAFEKANAESAGFLAGAKEILGSDCGNAEGDAAAGSGAILQLVCVFHDVVLRDAGIDEHVFASPNPEAGAVNFEAANAAFNEAANAVSSAMGVYGLSSMAFALLLAFYTSRYSINRRLVHGVSLAIGGLGFAWMLQLNPDSAVQLKWCFACIGVAWGSILSMPYAMLSSSVPKDQMGIYMGIFNMFIVIPNLAALGGINWVNGVLFDGNIAFTMMIAGSVWVLVPCLVLVDRLCTDKYVVFQTPFGSKLKFHVVFTLFLCYLTALKCPCSMVE